MKLYYSPAAYSLAARPKVHEPLIAWHLIAAAFEGAAA